MAHLSRCSWLAVWLCVGCAHQPAPESTAPASSETARLRRDNVALRRRVQMLEDRVLKLERDTSAIALGPADRDLPVVRLEPEAVAAAPRGPRVVAQREAAPPRSVQLGKMPVPMIEDEGAWTDPSGFAAEVMTDVDAVPDAPAPAGGPSQSYRLVGSHLVEMTHKTPPPVEQPQRRTAKGIKAQYEQAMALLHAGNNVEAEAAFAQFAAAHPRHDYADNALYWQGEAAYDQAHYADALAAFTEVVERYAGGNKAPDALLKIGLCYGQLGDADNAKDVLTQLVSAYPGARASDIARARLAEYGL